MPSSRFTAASLGVLARMESMLLNALNMSMLPVECRLQCRPYYGRHRGNCNARNYRESARNYYPGIYRIRNFGTIGGNIERKLRENRPLSMQICIESGS